MTTYTGTLYNLYRSGVITEAYYQARLEQNGGNYDEVIEYTDHNYKSGAFDVIMINRDTNNRQDIVFRFDGAGSEIADNVKEMYRVGFDGYIRKASILANVTGSIVIDIWKDTYANFPPTDSDSITASAVPTISNGVAYENTALTGWTTAFSAGDTFIANIDSCTTIVKAVLVLTVEPSTRFQVLGYS
jgi:hypothetical protein